jgi:hypothetical protein
LEIDRVVRIAGDHRRFWGIQALGNPSAESGQCLTQGATTARFPFLGGGASVPAPPARGVSPMYPEAVIEQLVAPAYLRLLPTGGPLDHTLIADSVQRTLAAFAR